MAEAKKEVTEAEEKVDKAEQEVAKQEEKNEAKKTSRTRAKEACANAKKGSLLPDRGDYRSLERRPCRREEWLYPGPLAPLALCEHRAS